MDFLVRKLAALICLFTLAACGPSAPAAPARPLPTDPAAQVRVSMPVSRMAPDWVMVARQRDCPDVGELGEDCEYGSVFYNTQTITRSVDGTVANIWAQVDHGATQTYVVESEDTITRIRYLQSRIHYRFRCEEETFAIIERQIMGDNEAVVQREHPPEAYRAPVRWSAVSLLMPIACDGGTLQP